MEIRSSATYIWNIKDVMGQGATGAVYRGRHKVMYFRSNGETSFLLNIPLCFKIRNIINGYVCRFSVTT